MASLTRTLGANLRLDITTDALTTATVVELDTSNKATGSVTAIAASSTGSVGPNNSTKTYRITYTLNEPTITETLDSIVPNSLPASSISSGTIVHERGGLEADVSAYDGLLRIASGATSNIKMKVDATSAPGVSNDTTEDYSVGSIWIDVTNDKAYYCLDATEGAAVWTEITQQDTDTTLTLIDDDTFATATASNVPSAESTKAYVDTAVAGAGGGAWTFISTSTASTSSQIDFTDLSSTYVRYLFLFEDVVLSADGNALFVRMSTDNGSTFISTSTYQHINLGLVSDSASVDIDQSTADSVLNATHYAAGHLAGNAAGESISGSLELINPSQTSYRHQFVVESQYIEDVSGDNVYHRGIGYNTTTSAVNALRFYPYSGTITSGTFKLYGLSAS